jgi:hypothetical protein
MILLVAWISPMNSPTSLINLDTIGISEDMSKAMVESDLLTRIMVKKNAINVPNMGGEYNSLYYRQLSFLPAEEKEKSYYNLY